MEPGTGIINTRGRGRGLWKEGQEFTELRRPHTSPIAPVEGVANTFESTSKLSDPAAGGDCIKSSRLSADAKEFFPRGYIAEQNEEKHSSVLVASYGTGEAHFMDLLKSSSIAVTTLQCNGDHAFLLRPQPLKFFFYSHELYMAAAGGDTSPSGTYSFPDHLTDSYLSSTIHNLTLNPGLFNSCVGTLTELLLRDSEDLGLHKRVVANIVDKSIVFPNFRYTGARLLCHFRNALPNDLQHDFRKCLLRICQEENAQVPELLLKSPHRVQGFALFLGEVFMQMEVTVGGNERIRILGSALYEVIKSMMTHTTEENVKCVCQVLKLSGIALDEQDTHSMDLIIETLNSTKETAGNANVVHLITSLIKLRQNAWRLPTTLPPVPSVEQSSGTVDPLYYLRNGEALSAEESNFLQQFADDELEETESDQAAWGGSEQDDDEEEEDDPEFEAAYEAFLVLSNQVRRTS